MPEYYIVSSGLSYRLLFYPRMRTLRPLTHTDLIVAVVVLMKPMFDGGSNRQLMLSPWLQLGEWLGGFPLDSFAWSVSLYAVNGDFLPYVKRVQRWTLNSVELLTHNSCLLRNRCRAFFAGVLMSEIFVSETVSWARTSHTVLHDNTVLYLLIFLYVYRLAPIC